MKICKYLTLLSISFFSLTLWGQTSTSTENFTPDDSDFMGLVQFVQGRSLWLERPKRNKKDKVAHKSFIHQADVIGVTKKSYVKIITFDRCIAVSYGKSKLYAPKDIDRPIWTAQGGSLRWVCPPDQKQKIKINGFELQIEGGEILFHKKKLLVKKGTVSTPQATLKENYIYSLENDSWLPMSDEPMEVWKFNQLLPQPKESLVLEEPKIENKEDTSRWMISKSMNIFSEMEHNESLLNIEEPTVDSENLMFHYKKGDKGSLIGVIRYSELQSRNEGENFCYYDSGANKNICTTGFHPNNHNNIDWLGLEIGWRTIHLRTWSTYYLVGINSTQHRINSQLINQNIFLNREEKYLALSLSLGIDYLLEFGGWWKWLGISFNLEARALQSLHHESTNFKSCYGSIGGSCESNADRLRTDTDFLIYGLYFSVGPFLRF